jgi:hypothetical protein
MRRGLKKKEKRDATNSSTGHKKKERKKSTVKFCGRATVSHQSTTSSRAPQLPRNFFHKPHHRIQLRAHRTRHPLPVKNRAGRRPAGNPPQDTSGRERKQQRPAAPDHKQPKTTRSQSANIATRKRETSGGVDLLPLPRRTRPASAARTTPSLPSHPPTSPRPAILRPRQRRRAP